MPQLTNLDRPDGYYEDLATSRNTTHDLHCSCRSCWKTPVCCMVCRFEFRHVHGLSRHRAQFHNGSVPTSRKAIRARVAQREVIPDGLGYLTTLFAHDAKSKVDFRAFSKFAEHLNDLLEIKKPHRSQQIINSAVLRVLQNDKIPLHSMNLKIPTRYAIPVYRIWEASGVAPNSVTIALIAYGLEHLAQELKRYPIAPEVPKNPQKKLAEPNIKIEPKLEPKKETPLHAQVGLQDRGLF